MPAVATACATESDADDDLELSCTVCGGRVGAQQRVMIWPIRPRRPGLRIAHLDCVADAVPEVRS